MKRLWVLGLGLALTLGARPVRAEETGEVTRAEHARPEGEKRSVSEVIFGHVSDDHELEFESPFGGETRIALPEWKQAFGIPWLDLSLTKHTVWMWVAAVLLTLVFLLFRPRNVTPRGFQVVLETLVLFVRDEIAKPTISAPEYKKYTPYLCSAFFFILVANLLGLLPYASAATSNVAVTAGLALCTFVITQFASIRAAGLGGYLKHLTGGVHWALWPIMIPVEVLGLFTKPFALCLRLFANMVAGHIVIFYLLALIFIFRTAAIAPVSVFLAVCIYLLEIFVALLQAYVFTMLSSVFIGMGVAMGHHADHGEHGAGEHGPAHP